MSRRFNEIHYIAPQPVHIMNNSQAVFANDLVFFMASEYQTGWKPPGARYYYIHNLSPFDEAMQRAARILVRSRAEDYNAKYNDLVPPGAVGKLQMFVDYTRCVLSSLFEEGKGAADLFLNMVYIARLSSLFRQKGTPDAPTFAAIMISHAVAELKLKYSGFYRMLSQFAAGVTHEQA